MRTSRDEIANHMLEGLNGIADTMPKKRSKIKIAMEYIRFFFGVKTDNYLIDLRMERDHLGYFGEYISETEKDPKLREYVLTAQNKYKQALEEYKRIKDMQSMIEEGINGQE